MAKKPLPSPEVLRQLLRYDPKTGKLFWKERGPDWFSDTGRSGEHNAKIWNKQFAGREAFTALKSGGYKSGSVLCQGFLAHRVAWAIAYGQWPSKQVDHVNGDRTDNRLSNLRDVSQAENAKNLRLRSDNTSGVVGVSWLPKTRKWKAAIQVDGRSLALGTYSTKRAAACARKDAERIYGFHTQHGLEKAPRLRPDPGQRRKAHREMGDG